MVGRDAMSDTTFRSITCGTCGLTSHNPNDVREGYCGNCNDWTNGRINVESGAPDKPEWARGNPLVKLRKCPKCDETWWEHDHSLSAFIGHMNDRHPDWKEEGK